MRDLGTYSIKDWLQFLPFVERGKQIRYDFVQQKFLKSKPKAFEEFLAGNRRLQEKIFVSIIGFEEPELLSFSLKLATRHLTDATIMVFDNSRRMESRVQIEKVCRSHWSLISACGKIRTVIPTGITGFR